MAPYQKDLSPLLGKEHALLFSKECLLLATILEKTKPDTMETHCSFSPMSFFPFIH